MIIVVITVYYVFVGRISAKLLSSTSPILVKIFTNAIPNIIQVRDDVAWSENFSPLLLHSDLIFSLLDSA